MVGPAEHSAPGRADRDETLRCLERWVREEAQAAATATSVEATLIHVSLASAYAKLFGDRASPDLSGECWVQEQRVW